MSVVFDDKQLEAINTRGNVIVSASAGSGKTTVMVERIARLLKEGKHLKNMLVCTFTRASAADMRGKIHAKILELAEAGLCDKSELDFLPLADIGTLHGFCRTITRAYFFAAGFDPSVDVGDENDSDTLLAAAVDTAIEKVFAKGDASDLDIIEAFGGNDDLNDIVYSAVRYAQSVPEGELWFDKKVDAATARAALLDVADRERERLKSEFALLQLDAEAVGGKLTKIIQAIKLAPDVLDGACSFPSTRLTGGNDNEVRVNERYKGLKDEVTSVTKFIEKVRTADGYSGVAGAASLCKMAREAYSVYDAKKRAAAIVDYGDLERGALKVLNDEVAFDAISKRYNYIFIDEYQDINPLQDAICRRLGERAETFLVGDPKQSIYAFRHCDPKYFLDALKRDTFHAVRLNNNFRSEKSILDFTNTVFSRAMTVADGGVDYANEGMLRTSREAGGRAELKTLVKEGKAETAKGIYSVRAQANAKESVSPENELIVSEIFEFLKGTVDGRAVNFGDIAVLVETRSPKVNELVECLKRRGIPATLNGGFEPFEDDGLKPLISVLRAVDNRLDDLPLVGAMKGVFGFCDAELEEIANGKSFHEAVFEYNGALKPRIDNMINALNRFESYARFLSAAQLTAKTVSETAYFDFMAERGEDVRKLEILLDYLKDKFDSVSIHAFLDAAEQNKISLDLPRGQNAVSIMTVHASKGLEFPFVILAHTGKRFNSSDLVAPCLFTRDGLIMKALDGVNLSLIDTHEYMFYAEAARHEGYEQHLRVLYVALTRAKCGLVVTGTAESDKPPEIKGDRAQRLLEIMRPFVPETRLTAEECTLPETPETRRVYVNPDESITNAIAARITFAPPSRYSLKTSVTAVAEVFADDEEAGVRGESLPYIDGDRAGKRGTAYHKAMELVDFSCPDSKILEGIEDGELVEFCRIERAAAAINERFADYKAYRERRFMSDMPRSIVNAAEGDETVGGRVLVQGVIDLLLVKGDRAVIVDYKTTELNSIESKAYRKQLELYKYAVESALSLTVERTLLYSFVDGAFY